MRKIFLLTLSILQLAIAQYAPVFTTLIGNTIDASQTAAKGGRIFSNGDAVVCGHTTGTIQNVPPTTFGVNVVIQRYSPLGTVIWTTLLGANNINRCNGVAVDGGDNVYVSGECTGTLPNTTFSGGKFDMCYAKFSSSGKLLLAGEIGTFGNDVSLSVAADKTRNVVYISGYASRTAGTPKFDGTPLSGSMDEVLLKYSDSLVKLAPATVYAAGAGTTNIFQAVTVDVKGDVIAVGVSDGNWRGLVNNGYFDITVYKMNKNGVEVFKALEGGPDSDAGAAVTSDASSNIYVVGSVASAFDGQTLIGGSDIAVITYNAGGVKKSTRFYGGTGYESPRDVAVHDATKRLFIVGYSDSDSFYGQVKAAPAQYYGFLLVIDMTTKNRVYSTIYSGVGLYGNVYFNGVSVTDTRVYVIGQVIADSYQGTALQSSAIGVLHGFVNSIVVPSATPTKAPTRTPSLRPTVVPTRVPTVVPTRIPTATPSKLPTRVPTAPTRIPTRAPSTIPSRFPTVLPTKTPTKAPTAVPLSQMLGQMICPPYWTVNTRNATQNTVKCPIVACNGATIAISVCASETLNLATCAGSMYLRVKDPQGNEMASLSNAVCGQCDVYSFTAKPGNQCELYTIEEGCMGNESCSGTVVVQFNI